MASKFFEHFVAIVDAMNTLGGDGLWDEEDGFYYDHLHVDGQHVPLRMRSMVGLIPLFAVEVLDGAVLERLPGFRKRMEWFLEHRTDLRPHIAISNATAMRRARGHRLLAIPSRERLERVLALLLDESEFLSPFGMRSLSREHAEHPACSTSTARSTASTTSRASRGRACSAATRTGAVRSGSRSTTC